MKIEFDTTNLKHQIQEQPLIAAGIGAAVLKGIASLMNANTARVNSKSWKREVNRREKNSK